MLALQGRSQGGVVDHGGAAHVDQPGIGTEQAEAAPVDEVVGLCGRRRRHHHEIGPRQQAIEGIVAVNLVASGRAPGAAPYTDRVHPDSPRLAGDGASHGAGAHYQQHLAGDRRREALNVAVAALFADQARDRVVQHE